MKRKRLAVLLPLLAMLQACAPSQAVLTSDGLVSRSGSDPFLHLQASYERASAIQLRISKNEANSAEAQAAFSQLVKDGFSMVDLNCADFFHKSGLKQEWLIFGRDLVGAIGSLATAVAAATRASSALTTGFAIGTAAAYNGLDIYQRDFLFGSDNIDATRTLVQKMMASYSSLIFKDTTPWRDFGQAAFAIMKYQELCMPASILLNVRAAIKNPTLDPQPAADGTKDVSVAVVSALPMSTGQPAPPSISRPNPLRTPDAADISAQMVRLRAALGPLVPEGLTRFNAARDTSIRFRAAVEVYQQCKGQAVTGFLTQAATADVLGGGAKACAAAALPAPSTGLTPQPTPPTIR